ncbi:hypothetical protein MPTK1_2g01190 [Marchantia polymorpha subsp. ruderalis]
MADKDKKKLKVTLKLPKTHMKSPATAPLPVGAQAAPNSSASALSFLSSQFSPSQDHRKNVSSHHAGALSSALQAQSASHLRSASASASAAAPGSVAASTTTSAPGSASNAPNTQQHTPLKKRKFKVVGRAGRWSWGLPAPTII